MGEERRTFSFEEINAGSRVIHANYSEQPWGEYADKVWARGTFRAALRAANIETGPVNESDLAKVIEDSINQLAKDTGLNTDMFALYLARTVIEYLESE